MKCSTVRVPGSPSAGINRPSNTIACGACLPGTGLLVLIAMLIALAVLMVPVGAADNTSDTSIATAHNAIVTTGTVVPTVSITTIPTTSLASLFADDRESINVVDQGVSRTFTPYEEDLATVSSGSDTGLQTHYLSSIKTGNLAGTAWPKFQNNLNNTGTSPYSGPHIGNDVWTYTTGDLIRGQPVIGAEGTIYLGSYDKKLYAFNPDGSVKWSYTTGNQIVGSAAIGADGILYIGSYDTKLYAINPDGTLNWSYTTGNRIFGSPAIGSDGTVYVGSRDKNLYALNPDGTLKWRYTTGHQIFSSAAIGTDGTIFIASLDNKLYALNPDGTLKWSYTTGNQIYGSPAIGSDGTIYIGSLDNKLYALNPDGTLKWSYSTGNQIYGSPALGSDGTIFIGSYDNKLYALNHDGTLKWSYTTGNPVLGSAVIGADRIIYIGSLDNKLYAINPDGSLKWSYSTGNQIYGSSAIGADGTLYIGSFDSTLYAFRDAVPVVKFTSSSTGGEAPLAVQFTDLSKGNITARLWDFGDSQTSTEKNPTHTYVTTGSYTVNLTVSNDMGSNSSVQTGYITVGTGIPVGNFTANVTTSTAPPLMVQFTDTTTVNPTAWHWDFGDNATSAERNPDHTYATAGIYTVNLTVSNSYGSNSCVKTGYITVGSGIPVGAFTANTTSGNAPLTVQFTDGSTLNPIAWYWDCGDNVTSTEQNPVHVYTADGSYTVNLRVSNSYGSNNCMKTGYITVGSGIPVGAFIANTTSGNAPLTVKFTDTSTINPTAWSWDFGDNATSAEQNPVHIYAANGNYTINLTVSNSYGSNNCVKTDYIMVGSGIPVGAFIANTTSGNAPLTVQFTDTSTINPTAWSWDFGDGATSTEQNPVHIYAANGNYTVNLTVSNTYGSNSCVKTDYFTVGSGIPVGAFIANATSGNAPLTVQFTDTSMINPTAWSWDFGDNATSAEQNPVHTYAANGNYTVNMTVSNTYGSNSCVKSGYITVGSGIPVGNFTANKTSGNVPCTIQFTDTSTITPTAWFWDFGDNSTSSDQNPVHTYATDGSFTVNLTVSNSYGSNSCVKIGYITIGSGIPLASFTADVSNGFLPFKVRFTDTSVVNPTAWAWDFGDGTNSNEQNPVHTYTNVGNYTVNLTVSNSYGTNTLTKDGYIHTGRYAFSQNITYTAGDQNVIQQEVIIHRTTGSPYEENQADGTKVWHVQVGDQCRADYGDIRFADATGTPLAYYLWSHYSAEQGRFIVRLEKAYQPGTLQVLYGDSSVLSTSNVDAIGAYLIDEFDTLNSTWSGGAIENSQLTYTSSGATSGIYGVTRPITPIPAEFLMETDLSYEPYGYHDGDVMLEVYTSDSYARIGYYQANWGGGGAFATMINGLQMPFLGGGTSARPEPGAMKLKITRDASNKISAYENGTLMGTGTLAGSITHIGFRVNNMNNGGGGHTSHWDNLAIRSYSTALPAASGLKPVGSFSANSTSGDAPLTVRFTAISFNSPTTWAWDFGDGATSTDQNPVHTYSAGGNYTVNLTLSNNYGSNSFVKTDYITIGSGIPVGNFTTTWTNGYAPLIIQFTDTSTINPTSWAWDFGDGATSTSQNPVHSYSAAGNYTVTLTATNGYGSNTITKSGYIFAGSVGYSQNFSFTASDQAMYQQEVVIHRADGTNYEEITNGLKLWHVYVGDRCREDYSDLRFTDATGIQLAYYLLPDYNTNQARLYVRLERADQPGTLQILYGNRGVPSASNEDATGCVVDSFTTLNPNWDTSGVSSATIDNGQLKLTAKTSTQGKSSTAAVKRSITPITGGFAAEVDLTYVSSYPSQPSRSRGELYLILYNSSSNMAAGYFDSWSSSSATNNGSFFYAIGGTSANTGRGTRPAVGGMHLTITRDAANTVSVYENGILRATSTMPGAISSIGLANTRYSTDSYYYNTYWDNLVIHSFSTTPPGAYGFQPVGNFTANKLSGSAPLTVQFNDTSRYYPTSWLWDFGDNTTSADQNPVHSYAADGNYTVNLTVTNSYGNNSLVKIGYITVGSGIPVASFTADVTNGYSPVTVQFTDTSTINPTSWAWDFGDGTTSIEQNPVHTYSTYGTNTVTLTATNGYGSNTITKADLILSGKNAYSQKIDFSAGELSLYLQVVMIHRTTGAAYEDNATGMKVWHLYAGGHCREDYGDVRFTDANGFPVKYYLQPGYTAEQARFSIRLEGADHPGALKVLYGEPGVMTTSDVSITNITVNATASLPSATIFSGEGYTDAAPAASFTGTPVYGLSHTIRFTDTSANYPTTWSWDFGDGTTSTLQNPVHTFTADGNYTVTLSATNEYGSDTETIRDYTVEMPVVASVTVSPTSVQLNVSETRQFTAVLLDQNGNTMTNTSVTWSSSDETVGTVDTKGLFTARHLGKANVTVSAGGLNASTEVTVIIPTPDLTVSALSTLTFSPGYNTVTATIHNLGPVNAGAFKANFTFDGNTQTINITGITAGSSSIISATDTVFRKYNEAVPITIDLDTENAIPELNETNNKYTATVTVGLGGDYYSGGRFYTGNDLEAGAFVEGHVALVYALSGGYQTGGGWYSTNAAWSPETLPIPSGATIKEARLFQSYTWNSFGNPGFTLQFNGNTVNQSAFFGDGIDNFNGQAVYNVTPYFDKSGNTAIITAASPGGGLYGSLLAVVYENASEPYRMIWLDQGCDSLNGAATGYAMFHNVTTNNVYSAKLTTILPSGGDNSQGSILFNNQNIALTGTGGSDPGFKYYTVTGTLQNGTNELGVYCDGYMNLAAAFLEVTRDTVSEAHFTATPLTGTVPHRVIFTDTSTGTPTSWFWDFGDGTNSTLQNPSHRYMVEGTFNVTLTVSNSLGSDSKTKTGYITVNAPSAPVAAFSATPTTGPAPLTVTFTDASTNTPTSWAWDFGDSDTTNATEQNPVHTYAAIGTYTVKLTATNALGSDDETKTGFITVTAANPAPKVAFTATPTSGNFPLAVQFNDTSIGNVTTWAWDFTNDGTIDSTEKNPAYTYTNAGSYAVNLTVTGPEGTNSTVKPGYVTVNIITGTTLPLANDKNGTVSGGLYVGSFQPVPFASQPATGVTSRDFDQPFSIPAFTNIQWAKVYVNVYSMSGSRDIPSRTTTSLDGNGDGTYETVLGVEEMTSGSSYSTDGKVYWINDHTNRVYSDYETAYDVTSLITSSHPAVHVKNEKTGTEYDGRLKAVTLVVAYNDGDSDTVKYWVNHGHDWINSGSSSTTFGTAGIPTGFTDATLNNVALSSADGTYTFNGVSQAGANPVAPINYYENHTWSVTGAVNPAADSVFQYALGTGSSFKTTLAALTVKYPGTPSSGIQVQVVGADGNPMISDRIALEGGAVPLNVTNTSDNRFGAVPEGTYQLIVTKAGYIGVNTTISYVAGSTRNLTATLVPHAYQPTVILAETGVSLAGMTHAASERMNALRNETNQYNLTLNGGGVVSVALEYPMRFQINQPQVTSALPVVTEIRNGTFLWTNPEYTTTNATIVITTVPASGQSPLCLLLTGGKLGDVYDNDQVTSTDSLYILHYVVGNLKSLPTYDYADITRDGKVTSTDALYTLHYIVGNVNEYYEKV